MEIRNLNPVATTPAATAARTPAEAPKAQEVPLRSPAESSVEQTKQAVRAAEESREGADRRELQESLERVNEAVKVFNSSVRFSVDEETKQQVVKVVDVETDEVIRQIPSEDVLAIARAFDKLQGLLLKDKA